MSLSAPDPPDPKPAPPPQPLEVDPEELLRQRQSLRRERRGVGSLRIQRKSGQSSESGGQGVSIPTA